MGFFRQMITKALSHQEGKCWQRIGGKAGFILTHPHLGPSPRTAESSGNQSG